MPEIQTVIAAQAAVPQATPQLAAIRRPGIVMALVRVIGTGLQFLVQMLLGQLGGPAAIAVMQTFLSVATVLGEVIARGTPAAAMRRVAVLWTQADRSAIERYLKGCIDQILMAALVVGLAAVLLRDSLTQFFVELDATPGTTIGLVMVGMLAFAAQRLFADAAKSMERSAAAVAAETLIPPLVTMLALAGLWSSGAALSTLQTLGTALASLAATSAAVAFIARQQVISLPRRSPADSSTGAFHTREGLALWMVSLLGVLSIQMPFLVLPLYADAESVGSYAVAFKLLAIATTVLVMLSAVFGPAFARAADGCDAVRARALLYRSQLVSCAILFPVAGLLLIGSDWLAQWFNVPSDQLSQFLMIIALGQAVNAATGLPGLLLNMSGAAASECFIAAACLLLALLAMPIVGTQFGAVGIAWLFTGVMTIKNLVSFFTAHRTIGGWQS